MLVCVQCRHLGCGYCSPPSLLTSASVLWLCSLLHSWANPWPALSLHSVLSPRSHRLVLSRRFANNTFLPGNSVVAQKFPASCFVRITLPTSGSFVRPSPVPNLSLSTVRVTVKEQGSSVLLDQTNVFSKGLESKYFRICQLQRVSVTPLVPLFPLSSLFIFTILLSCKPHPKLDGCT